MNNTVVYKNEMNLVPLKSFSQLEMDVFFAILSQMKDKGSDTVTLDFVHVRELSGYGEQSYKRFIDGLKHISRKLKNINFVSDQDNVYSELALFPGFEINENDNTLTLQVNQKLNYLLNDLKSEFTKYELQEFTNISSKYTKTLYRLLKQFRDTGFYIVSIEEFRKLLDIPKSYRMSDINKQIINPSIEELSKIFENLHVEHVRKNRKVVRLKFMFEKQTSFSKSNLPKIPMYNWLEGGEDNA